MPQEIGRIQVLIRSESDIAVARRHIRELSSAQGFTVQEIEGFATAVSEITRNSIVHARGGIVTLSIVRLGLRVGIIATMRDDGGGIASIEDAMRDGFSTRGGLGLGLPSARRLVDEFELESSVAGTTVILKRWHE